MPVQSSFVLITQKQFKINFLMYSCLTLLSFFVPQKVIASIDSNASLASLNSSQQQRLNLAIQNIKEKQFNQALLVSKSVLKEVPDDQAAQFIRANALSGLGKTDEAVVAYQEIIKSQDSHSISPEVYNNLASLLAQQGKLDEARQTLEAGIATSEQYKTLYNNLSAIYVEMARGAYSKALKLGVQAKSVQLKTLQLASIPVSQTQTVTQLAENTVLTKPKQAQQTKVAVVAKQEEPLAKIKTIKQENKNIEVITKAKPVEVKAKINKDEVITALHGWAAAWSAQAVDLYLSFYGKDFKPENLSKKVWAVQRRIRLNKPRWVNVRLNDFNIRPYSSANDQAVVQLVQDYRADNYRDKTKKQFIMKRTVDGWRILSEHSLAVLKP